VVTLDRVICCYPDVLSLVSRSAMRATRLYGLVYPVDRWWTRAVARIMNVLDRLGRSDYRMHVHPQVLVDQLIRDAGLEPHYRHAGMVWQTAVYARVSSAR
jgi:magnesium-protoporphyrin O-methyltransferase